MFRLTAKTLLELVSAIPVSVTGREHDVLRRYFSLFSPSIDFELRILGHIAVVSLEALLKFGAAAFDNIKIVIAELAPLSLHLTAEFVPLFFNLIPIHGQSPFIRDYCQNRLNQQALPHGQRRPSG
jgi:hypothetical protein